MTLMLLLLLLLPMMMTKQEEQEDVLPKSQLRHAYDHGGDDGADRASSSGYILLLLLHCLHCHDASDPFRASMECLTAAHGLPEEQCG